MRDPKRITSPANPVIKDAVRIRTRRTRFGSDAFILDGPNLVEAALFGRPGASVRSLFYTAQFMERESARLGRFIEAATDRDAEIYELGEKAMQRLSDVETPQGVAALAAYMPLSLGEVDSGRGPLVVSDGISDPGNMGVLIRTADAVGASAVVVLDGSCDPFSPKALRASAGSVFSLPLVYEVHEDFAGRLKAMGLSVAASSPHGGKDVFDADLAGRVAFVFGNESAGVSPVLMDAADVVVSIPIRGSAESLNVGASAAVLLYEGLRQSR